MKHEPTILRTKYGQNPYFCNSRAWFDSALLEKIEAQRNSLLDEDLSDDDTDDSVPMHIRLIWYNAFDQCTYANIHVYYSNYIFICILQCSLDIISHSWVHACMVVCQNSYGCMHTHVCVCYASVYRILCHAWS